MTTDIKISLPDDLRTAMEAAAQAEGKTLDELAVEAMRRYLAHQWLNKIDREGQERRWRAGLKTDKDPNVAVSADGSGPNRPRFQSIHIRPTIRWPGHAPAARLKTLLAQAEDTT